MEHTDKQIELLEEEAQANLNLYLQGKDDYALQRYQRFQQILNKIRNGKDNRG
jgi:hypothetical protein